MAQFDKNEEPATSTVKPDVKAGMKKDESIAYKVGDVVERVGEKLKDMGANKIGSAVYNAGNKLEHSEELKKH